jgi:hypothetical protein
MARTDPCDMNGAAEMPDQGNHPAVEDTARPVFPVTFFKGGDDGNTTDWRAEIVPADAPEEDAVPKAESAPEPVESSESPKPTEPTEPEDPAPTPADKDTGQPKVESPGQPDSSDPTTTGKPTPPAKAVRPSGSTPRVARPS